MHESICAWCKNARYTVISSQRVIQAAILWNSFIAMFIKNLQSHKLVETFLTWFVFVCCKMQNALSFLDSRIFSACALGDNFVGSIFWPPRPRESLDSLATGAAIYQKTRNNLGRLVKISAALLFIFCNLKLTVVICHLWRFFLEIWYFLSQKETRQSHLKQKQIFKIKL